MAGHIPGSLYFDRRGTPGLPMIFLHSTPDDHRLHVQYYPRMVRELDNLSRTRGPRPFASRFKRAA